MKDFRLDSRSVGLLDAGVRIVLGQKGDENDSCCVESSPLVFDRLVVVAVPVVVAVVDDDAKVDVELLAPTDGSQKLDPSVMRIHWEDVNMTITTIHNADCHISPSKSTAQSYLKQQQHQTTNSSNTEKDGETFLLVEKFSF